MICQWLATRHAGLVMPPISCVCLHVGAVVSAHVSVHLTRTLIHLIQVFARLIIPACIGVAGPSV